MAAKPRTTRSKRPKNGSSPKSTASNESSESGLFVNAYNAVAGLSIPQKVGLGVSAVALLSTAFVTFGPAAKSGKNKMKSLTPDGRRSKMEEIEPWKCKTPRRGKKGKKGKTEMISTEQITKAFQTCLASKRPQQQLVADEFFSQIKMWSSDQLEVDGQTIVVNFLFWYYRSANVPATRFTSEQAEHIRYWADYPITADLKWDFYNIKFDYLYSTALLQQSIPHMKQFYRWICGETPRSVPEDASSRKPNYYLTKYQAACILGDWKDGVKTVGQRLKALSNNGATAGGGSGAATTRSDYFMHYTLRALELPTSNPNFGLMYKIVDKLEAEFPPMDLPPPQFGSWSILSFKYKNSEDGTSYLQDQDFIFASDKIKGDDGWYTFYPQQSTMTSRLPKKVQIWGRVCQMVSPVFGAAGFLPLTGSWSDTKLYMQTNWTFRGKGNRLTRKHVIMRCERFPLEEEVESKDFFGKTKSDKGFLWRGHITIHMKKLPKGMTIRNLYDDEGEDYFDGEAAIQKKREQDADVKGNGAVSEVNENADNDAPSTSGTTETATADTATTETAKPAEESLTETQVYEVELVISKEDAADKSKEMTKAILSKMRNSPTALSSAQVLRQ